MKRYLIALGFLLSSITASAEIRSIQSLDEVPDHVDEEAYVFFQVDEVLMTATTSLGSSEWLTYRLKKRTDAGMSYEEAVLEEVPVYMEIQRKATMRLMEKGLSKVLDVLDGLDASLFAISWRPPSLNDCTLNQLESLGLTFGDCDDSKVDAEYPARITNHVLFSGVLNKQHDVLITYMASQDNDPEQVVLVEGSLEKLKQMEKACKEEGLRFLGLHYKPPGQAHPAFNPELAETQLKVFGTILNDRDAEKLLEMKLF